MPLNARKNSQDSQSKPLQVFDLFVRVVTTKQQTTKSFSQLRLPELFANSLSNARKMPVRRPRRHVRNPRPGDVPYGFELPAGTAHPPNFQTPPFKNADNARGPWSGQHVHYLFDLVQKAMEQVTPRRLLREDFIAIAEALHRRFQGTTDPLTNIPYRIRGVNAIHTYAVKHCRDRYQDLQARVERAKIRELEGRGAAGTSST